MNIGEAFCVGRSGIQSGNLLKIQTMFAFNLEVLNGEWLAYKLYDHMMAV